MLFRSIIVLAASTAAVSGLGHFPTDFAVYVENVASLIKDTPFYPQMSQAVQLLEAGYGLPGQQAHDEKIFSSLLMALSSQNVPSQATSIAGSLVSVLENNDTPQRLAALVSSMVAELKNPSVNTELASIVDELVTFVIQVHAEATRHADDTPVGPTPTTTSAPTSTSADATFKNSVSSDSPLSKSNAAHPMKPLFGYLSMGVAGVVASFI